MDNEGGSFDVDIERTYNPHLPVLIPVARPPLAAAWPFALPPWRLVLAAALASGLGILTATLWPYNSKLTAVAPPPPAAHNEAPNAADRAEHAPTTIKL